MYPTLVPQPHRTDRSVGASIGSRTLLTSELLCESVDLRAGERVLAAGCGRGSAALAAARRFCRVVGVDEPELLEPARRRAQAEGLEVAFLEGDPGELPFPDGSFDVVVSACEAMSAPAGEGKVAELLRVCRLGGRIGLVSWTPDGYVGRLFTAVGRHLVAPAAPEAPILCGTAERLRELFGPRWRSPPRGGASCGASPRPSTRWSSSPTSTTRPSRRWERWGRTGPAP